MGTWIVTQQTTMNCHLPSSNRSFYLFCFWYYLSYSIPREINSKNMMKSEIIWNNLSIYYTKCPWELSLSDQNFLCRLCNLTGVPLNHVQVARCSSVAKGNAAQWVVILYEGSFSFSYAFQQHFIILSYILWKGQ